MNFKLLFDKIHVYDGLFPDTGEVTTKIVELSNHSFDGIIYNNWRDWYTFGRICDARGHDVLNERLYVEKICERPAEEYPLLDAELFVWNSLTTAIRQCFDHYIGFYQIPVPQPFHYTHPNIAWYHPQVNTDGNGHTMNLHTDYDIGGWWWPGEKFFLTSTTYINDDYEGGEIVFYVDGELFSYKPRAGEILVFPSGDPRFPGKHPYFHAVNQTDKGRKILVRSYVKYFSPKNIHLWMSCQKRYGPDEWDRMVTEHAKGKNMLPWPGSDKVHQSFSENLIRGLYG